MNDMELAGEIEQYLAPDAIYYDWQPTMADMEQIIAALRRGHERPPSGEMVIVPREPTKAMIEAGTTAVDDGIDTGQDSYQTYDIYDSCDLANRAYRAMLSAAEGRKG